MKPVSPYKTGLHEGNAYWMARIAEQVYLQKSKNDQMPDEDRILANLKQEDDKFIAVYGFDKNSAQAAVIEHDQYLCMAFRGTNELKDWLDNMDIFATSALFGQFHRGFWKSVEDIWGPADSKCRDLQDARKRPVFFTGHSLGGAMATIAAAKYIHEDKPFTSAYTFGQPRAMTRSASQIFNMECKPRFFRFHNNNDLVTRVPARVMGYSHVGSYLYISEEEKICREPGFWFKFVDYFDGAVAALTQKGIDGVEDHDMAKYLAAVKAWVLET